MESQNCVTPDEKTSHWDGDYDNWSIAYALPLQVA